MLPITAELATVATSAHVADGRLSNLTHKHIFELVHRFFMTSYCNIVAVYLQCTEKIWLDRMGTADINQ